MSDDLQIFETRQGFFSRAGLAKRLENEDPAKALLTWIRTAVDVFLDDSGGPQNAVEGWSVFLDWFKNHRARQARDLTRPAEQVLQRIATHAEQGLRENDSSALVTDLRIVEPWIDDFFAKEGH